MDEEPQEKTVAQHLLEMAADIRELNERLGVVCDGIAALKAIEASN